MRNIVLNETPVRTSKNYGINNIEIKDFEEPVIKEFKNIKKIENEIFTIYDFVYHNLSHYQYIQKLDTKFKFSFKLINN